MHWLPFRIFFMSQQEGWTTFPKRRNSTQNAHYFGALKEVLLVHYRLERIGDGGRDAEDVVVVEWVDEAHVSAVANHNHLHSIIECSLKPSNFHASNLTSTGTQLATCLPLTTIAWTIAFRLLTILLIFSCSLLTIWPLTFSSRRSSRSLSLNSSSDSSHLVQFFNSSGFFIWVWSI